MGEAMDDHGSTSTWDDWLVGRSPSGDEFADGMARVLQDANFTMQDLDLSSAGTRDGLRALFAEFEAATAGQEIRGRALAGGFKRRAPDHWSVDIGSDGNVVITFGARQEPGTFVEMHPLTATQLVRDIVEKLEARSD
jgi:hypothetical protein